MSYIWHSAWYLVVTLQILLFTCYFSKQEAVPTPLQDPSDAPVLPAPLTHTRTVVCTCHLSVFLNSVQGPAAEISPLLLLLYQESKDLQKIKVAPVLRVVEDSWPIASRD